MKDSIEGGMKSKTLAINLIILSLILMQTPSASAPIMDNLVLGKITATGKGGVVPNYGYWGEVSNTELFNIKNVIVEVTTYDQSDAVIDTQTTMARPTIIEAGKKAPFLVISTKQPQVYREEIKIKSFEKTQEYNFPFIELTKVSELFNGGVKGHCFQHT